MNIKKAKITFDAQEGEVELLVFAAQAWGLSYLFLLLKPEACVTCFYRSIRRLELLVFTAQAGGLSYLTLAAQAWGLSYLFLLLKPEACVTIQLFYRIFCKSCIFQRRD